VLRLDNCGLGPCWVAAKCGVSLRKSWPNIIVHSEISDQLGLKS
jgi:hypothetical protein